LSWKDGLEIEPPDSDTTYTIQKKSRYTLGFEPEIGII